MQLYQIDFSIYCNKNSSQRSINVQFYIHVKVFYQSNFANKKEGILFDNGGKS